MKFAQGLPGYIGCVGCATVSKSDILAYFHDPDTLEINGRSFRLFDGYREYECIIDPTTIRTLMYQAVEVLPKRTNDSNDGPSGAV